MPNFRQVLQSSTPVFFDGGMGTMLQAAGLAPGQSPEEFGQARPEVIRDIHAKYRRAGAMVLTTNTFGATGFKLPGSMDVTDFNRHMATVAREAAGDACFVAGSVGPTGHFVRPLGDLSFRELVEAFKAQIKGLAQGGADLILAETHYDLAEVRAVVVAAREVCDLPVGASMTFENGVSLTGTSPAVFADTMRNMGLDLAASNCSAGPEGLRDVAAEMLPRLDCPLLIMPNAGLPELEDGKTVFRLAPDAFAEQVAPMAGMGVRCLGGCCGTTPEHIKALRELAGDTAVPDQPARESALILTSRSVSTSIGHHLPTVIIGERINPTGKKVLTAELQAGQFSEAKRLAVEQAEAGAGVLDVNVGAPMVDEVQLLPALVRELCSRTSTPLCIDSTNIDAVRAALDEYPGSALVNSISGEPGRMAELGPLCKLYGAPFIMLPLAGKKLPVTADERMEVVRRLLAEADELGIPRHLILVDALVLTVSSKPQAAVACFELLRRCRDELGLATTAGLSNVSFGLPARELVNSGFLTMGMAQGLTSCIANPGSARLRESLASGEILLNRDPQAARFVAAYAQWKPGEPSGGGAGGGTAPGGGKAATLRQAVIQGDRDNIVSMIDAALDKGGDPFVLVNDELIPGITEVGGKYERKEYFLPQLLLSAETMQIAFEHLRPRLEAAEGGTERTRIVMATVEGDIHDIGKNIVNLMLRNHGFDVIDLGKDVPAAAIVDQAEKCGAVVIGLSALMTTTMVRMEETVALVRERGLDAKIMIGGAVVSKDYADSIGAHGYAADAVDAVRVAKDLAGRN